MDFDPRDFDPRDDEREALRDRTGREGSHSDDRDDEWSRAHGSSCTGYRQSCPSEWRDDCGNCQLVRGWRERDPRRAWVQLLDSRATRGVYLLARDPPSTGGVARQSVDYTPRNPAKSVLRTVVQQHVETFLIEAAQRRDGEGLPRFVEKEFRAFLECGWLAGGFERFHCGECGLDRLVAYSCNGRGFCPSCGGRRMTERAAHLVDHVLPDVPVRQWVLSLPPRVRYLLAWDHDLCKAVVRVLLREVERHLATRAGDAGLVDPRGGAVAVVQRFGGALNLNVHVHALVLDGVFTKDREGRVAFHPAPSLTAADVADVLTAVAVRVERLLAARGSGSDEAAEGTDPFADATPVLAGLASASVLGVDALGRSPGAKPGRRGGESLDSREPCDPFHARWNAYDLHAGVVVPAGHRDRLERVCRYALRPPVADERLQVDADGHVVWHLRHPWRDGTTHLVFAPTAFLARLAVLVPRPRGNLLLYHGVLAPRAAWRADVVPPSVAAAETAAEPAAEPATRPRPRPNRRWAELMRRAFGFDVLACPRCGGRLRLVALLEMSAVTERILRHLHLSTERPTPWPARASPLYDESP